MKHIIITGEDGYIANHIKAWLEKKNEMYSITMLDVKSDEWKKISFKGVDVIIHTAGIVHRPEVVDWNIYHKTNVILTEELAKKAKEEKVKHFVFFSSMAVYGIGKKLEKNVIFKDTPYSPSDMYGKSKLEAENKLLELLDDSFLVSIVRPPNVYGYKCKGNYISGFTKIVKLIPWIPYEYTDIKQSMIYIDNLTELVKLIIDEEQGGVFMPQDACSISAVDLMKGIALSIGKRIDTSLFFGKLVRMFSFIPLVKKVYGGVEYDVTLSNCFERKYVICSFSEAIRETLKDQKIDKNVVTN